MAKEEIPKFLKDLGLEPHKYNWYGTFHNKKGHSHMRIIFYESDKKCIGKNLRIDKEKLNIAKIKMSQRVFSRKCEKAIKLKDDVVKKSKKRELSL